MNGMIRSLLWKEWHEQRWRVAFGCVLLGSFAALGLTARLIPDEITVLFTMLIGAFLLPLVAAMGLVAPERADGTMNTLIAMPVQPWMPLTVKLAVGLLGAVLPLVTAAVASVSIAGGRELPASAVITIYTSGAMFGAILVIWTLALSVRLSSEAAVGLAGMAVVAGWALLIILFEPSKHDFVFMTISPFGILDRGVDAHRGPGLPAFATQVLIAAGLLVWAARGLGKPGRRRP